MIDYPPVQPDARNDNDVQAESNICIHILTVSATLLGVCLTVIGLIRVVIESTHIQVLADDVLTFDSMFFLVSCVLSYWAIRTRSKRRMMRIEKFADAFFIFGLCLLVIACVMITYGIA